MSEANQNPKLNSEATKLKRALAVVDRLFTLTTQPKTKNSEYYRSLILTNWPDELVWFFTNYGNIKVETPCVRPGKAGFDVPIFKFRLDFSAAATIGEIEVLKMMDVSSNDSKHSYVNDLVKKIYGGIENVSEEVLENMPMFSVHDGTTEKYWTVDENSNPFKYYDHFLQEKASLLYLLNFELERMITTKIESVSAELKAKVANYLENGLSERSFRDERDIFWQLGMAGVYRLEVRK
jgi:hypothetical protein